jgi:hypothetical protein
MSVVRTARGFFVVMRLVRRGISNPFRLFV